MPIFIESFSISDASTGPIETTYVSHLYFSDSLTADCVDIKFENGKMIQHKPSFGGGIIAVIKSKTVPDMEIQMHRVP